MLFAELWTIVPAPNLQTLAFAVAIPEVTPQSIAFCLIAGAIAHCAGRGWARTVGVLCSAFALGCALVPWCLLPGTLERAAGELRLALGPAAEPVPPAGAGAALHRPYSVATALTGFPPPGAMRTRLDLPVFTSDGARLGLDVYAPRASGPHPTIVIIYGGAWIFGSRADSVEVARSFVGLGYTAIAIDYRHAPAFRFPTQLDDVRAALATIARHAKAWDVEPRRVALFGRSAGAQLALLAAYRPEPLTIRSVVAYYSPTDLIAGYLIPPRPDPADVRRILRAYLGGTPADERRAYVAASPIAHVSPGLPPTLLVGGGRDALVRLAFAHELRTALRAHGDRVAAIDLPWSNHAFDTIASGTGGQIARFYTARWVGGDTLAAIDVGALRSTSARCA